MASTSRPGPGGITITLPEVSTGNSNNSLNDVVIEYPTVSVVEDPNFMFTHLTNPNAGYVFAFNYKEIVFYLPITPSSLKMKIPSKNETVDLISNGEINIVKGPGLVEIEFDARYPMRNYPFARWTEDTFFTQWNRFKSIKEKKETVEFIVTRPTKALKYHNGYKPGWQTKLTVTIEDLNILEDADEGDDVIISFKLKQYKNYGVVKLKSTPSEGEEVDPDDDSTSTSTEDRPSDNGTDEDQTHKVVYGDTLWGIAQKYYGNGSKYMTIYNANKQIIEDDAKKWGFASSSNGNILHPGITLKIPKLS